MVDAVKLRWLYLISGLFLVFASVAIATEHYWYVLVPVALIIFYLALFSIDTLIFLVVLSTPLAINYENSNFNLGVSIPSEPLMFGIMLLLLFKIFHGENFDKRVFSHPVTIAILLNLFWITITVITSSMQIVSLKYLVARLWFVSVFYFMATQLFSKIENIKRFVLLYCVPMLVVIGYTMVRHAQNGFTQKTANWVMYPFYNDHTAYAAALALFLPLLMAMSFDKKFSGTSRFFIFLLFLCFVIALVMSYTRAAWMGIVAAIIFYIFIRLKLSFRSIVFIALIGGAIAYQYRTELSIRFQKNKSASSSDLAVHVKSISNVSTDASNKERINRWQSAMRMFYERPAFGWGPGTYQFRYAPYQISREKTIISTNSGNRGNAHSEYIGPLAETGLLGSLTFIAIVVLVIARGMRVIYESRSKEIRLLAKGILLGLITYFVHGALNNFLDTDKLSVPFWGMIAMLIALDVYHNKHEKKSAGSD
jgi:putative inorganic carbon (hco3(-)) transporter